MRLKFLSITTIVLVWSFFAQKAYANTVIDNGINFLKLKQDSSGKITGGFSSAPQWASIAFSTNNIDVSTIKNPINSLKDYLLTDIPSEGSATDWETRILAVVAIGDNPTNFGGINLVQNLETFYNNNQIGDTCALNDDIFGLLALIASGNSSNTRIKQDTLNFIISKQDATDGGFSWSAPSCPWYGAASDMTAAALQALQAAKDNDLANVNLDDAITKAKNYLLTNQYADGGFGYYGSSDADTTGWVLMAFNVLGMKDSSPALNAENYLNSKQDSSGGFLSWAGADSTTTAQAVIALTGKSWLPKIFNLSEIPSPTPTPTTIPTPTSPTTITSSELLSLLSGGYFTIPQTATSSATPSITLAQKVIINISTGSGVSSVDLPQGVIIRRSDGSNIDLASLSSTSVAVGTLSGFGSGTSVEGALQWGIPNVGLEFTSPVIVNVFVGSSLNGQTLDVVRSTNGTSGWTNDGIVDPKTCAVSSGMCSFQIVKASYFATTKTTTQNSSSNGQSSNPTSTPTPSPSPTPTPTPTPAPTSAPVSETVFQTPKPTSKEEVLGETTSDNSPTPILNTKQTSGGEYIFLLGLSIMSFIFAFLYWRAKLRK